MEADGGWMASVEFPSSRAQAFAATPEGAVEALVEAWRGYAAESGADPTLVADVREEVEVVRYATGKGYVIGGHDARWFRESLSGSDARFDDAFGGPERTVGRRR